MRRSRLSSYKQSRLIEHFVAGTAARTAASLVSVNKSSAAYYFHRLRELICAAIDVFYIPITTLFWQEVIGYSPVVILIGEEQQWQRDPTPLTVSPGRILQAERQYIGGSNALESARKHGRSM